MSPFGRLMELLDMDWDDDRSDRRRRARHDDDWDEVDRHDDDRYEDDDRSRPRGRRREGLLDGLLD